MSGSSGLKIIILLGEERAKEEAAAIERDAQLKALGDIPSWPEAVASVWPKGGKWNGKFYGHTGSWTIYLGGEAIELTNELKAEMEKIYMLRCEWRTKKANIEKKL